MNKLYEIKYQITDRGEEWHEKVEEIEVGNSSIMKALKKHLNKYRHAQDMSRNYKVKIITLNHIGGTL